MSNFPIALDDDTTLPIINDNLTQQGGDAINALRDAVFNIEQNIGIGAAGTTPSIAARLGLLINLDGTPNSSAITSLGLVTLPITNNQIIDNAGIPESKLHLDYRTQDLFNYIRNLSHDVNTALGWISISGTKLEPHLIGALYRHDLFQIDVAPSATSYLDNKFKAPRDNSSAYAVINDLNNELLFHQWADGSVSGTLENVVTHNGSSYPSYYAHLASGIFLQSGGFAVIPQTVQDVQALADFIDQASIFLYGTRIQNLYSNGVSRTSRSSTLAADGYGQSIVPSTPVIAYLSTTGSPLDDISTGDDMIKFVPTDGYTFTSQFALVRIGDIIRVNYGTVEVAFVVKEKKYSSVGSNAIYEVRIAGKNLFNTTTATARIDRSLFNTNKYGVLAVAAANNVYSPTSSNLQPSLIVGTPRGAQALGNGFNPDQFDNQHYLLYLALYPSGNPSDGYINLPPVDVTGNQGSRPGSYSLQSIVDSTNIAFRQPGFNYRFIAFQYQGQFGIMLADSYLGAAFSIINGSIIQSGSSAGQFDPIATNTLFQNNVIAVLPPNLLGTFAVNSASNIVNTSISQAGKIFNGSIISFGSQLGVIYVVSGVTATTITLSSNYNGNSASSTTASLPTSTILPDPLGFGVLGSGSASPPYVSSYSSAIPAQNPTQLFVPLKRNTYYVNGTERETLNIEVGQILDLYGDGYWIGTIDGYTVIPGSRVEVTYSIPLDLSTSDLIAGKTLVVQPLSTPDSNITNYGRFTIKSINVGCSPTSTTTITVYDGVHGTLSPTTIAPIGTQVAIYFNSSSITFNAENASDINSISPFKRYFESFVDQNGNTYTGERARVYSGGTPANNVTFDGITYYYILLNSSTATPNRLFASPGLQTLNIIAVSPKLRGYTFGAITKVNFSIVSVNATAGTFSGFVSRFDDSSLSYSNQGPTISGRQGQITRFYDETNIDYIDVIFDINSVFSFAAGDNIDFQLFPTLSLDQDIMQLSSCQVTDSVGPAPASPQITYLTDRRQFGNVSEQQLSTSALSFLSTTERLVFGSAVLRGFDLETTNPNPNPNAGQIFLTGGVALVNGSIIQMNDNSITIPMVQESFSGNFYNINWLLCVNDEGEYEAIPLLDVDTIVPTPNTSSRVVVLYNVINGQNYNTPCALFSDIINNRKDLAPLYVVVSTVVTGSSPSISLVVTDARRYLNDVDTNLPLRLTSADSQGNFRNIVSIFNWIKYNNFYNGTAIVKGANNISGLVSNPTILGFNSSVTFDGQNDATLSFGALATLGSNLTLQNMNLIFNEGVAISHGSTNLVLNNCNITIDMPTQSLVSPLARQYVFDLVNSSNISITNCTISVSFGANTTAGAVFRLTNTSDFLYNNTDISVLFSNSVGSGTSVPGDIFIIKNSANIAITDSIFSGNFNQLVRNTGSNNLLLQNFTATSTYNPNAGVSPDVYNTTTDPDGIADGLPVVTYNTSNLINSGRAYIYGNVSTNLNDITINNGIFNYKPSTITNDRFSFINFELSTNTAVLSDVTITGNQFNNTKAASTVEDIRGAVAIINTSPSLGFSPTSQQPILQNAVIRNNIANRNQTIVLTSVTVSALHNAMTSPGLATENCEISNNTIGNIGYWICAGSKTISTSPNVNSLSDKMTDLTIDSNNCHYIASMDHTGNYWLLSTQAVSGGDTITRGFYPSGNVVIKNNHCNWIHTAIAYEENSSLQILNNILCAYDINYLTNFNDVSPNAYGAITPANLVSSNFAIFVGSNEFTISTTAPGVSNNTNTIISGNIMNTGFWLQSNMVFFNYQYTIGYIMASCSAIITNNILKGIAETSGFGRLILVGGLNSIITDNQVYRQNNTVAAYVSFGNFDQVSGSYKWDGSTSTGMVTDNFFDSPFINNTTTNVMNSIVSETLVTLTNFNAQTYNWVVTRNKNQTGYVSVPLTSTNLLTAGPQTSGSATSAVYAETISSGTFYYVNQAPSVTGFGYKSLVLNIHDALAPITTKYLGWQQSLDSYVPSGTKIMLIQLGLKGFGTQVETPTNPTSGFDSNCYLYLNKYTVNSLGYLSMDSWALTPESTPDPNILNDILVEQSTPVSSVITGGQINATANTLLATIDTTTVGSGSTDLSSKYLVGDGAPISISVDFRYRLSNALDQIGHFYLAPIFVKFRW